MINECPIGISMLGECVACTIETPLDKAEMIFKLKFMDTLYSCTVDAITMTDEQKQEVWQDLLMRMFVNHSRGYKMIQKDIKFETPNV